jgi:hypothetical protein
MARKFFILAVLISSVGFGLCAQAQTATAEAAERTNEGSKANPAEDGWPDLSKFLDSKLGFLPFIMPITEPAVGYGAAGGVAFIDKPSAKDSAKFARPNITAVAGLGTDNGTWGVGAGDIRNWFSDRLQTIVGVVYASVNLDFYPMREDGQRDGNPLQYTLEPGGGGIQGKYRIGTSRVWVGLSYVYVTTQVSFDAPDDTPGLPEFRSESKVGCMTPTFTFDTRDNIFTPLAGTYFEASVGLFGRSLGGDDDFQRVQVIAMQYVPLGARLFLGLRGSWAASYSDPPFYLLPSVALRGAPLMRYQGQEVAQIETELRWQFWNRFSLLMFGGRGAVKNDFGRLAMAETVETGGIGFRYELARKYGIHMGADIAFGPDSPTFYVQMGSAWIRP